MAQIPNRYSIASEQIGAGLGELAQADMAKKKLAMEQAKNQFDELNNRLKDIEPKLNDPKLPDPLFQSYANEYNALHKTLYPTAPALPSVADMQPQDRKILANVYATLARTDTPQKDKWQAVQAYLSENMGKVADQGDFLSHLDAVYKQQLGGDVQKLEVTQPDGSVRNVQGKVNAAGEVLPVADAPNYDAEKLQIEKDKAANDKKTTALSAADIKLRERSQLISVLGQVQNAKDPKGIMAIIQNIPSLAAKFSDPTKITGVAVQNALIRELAKDTVDESPAGPDSKSPPPPPPPVTPNGKLMWQGKPIKDTPANRKWLEQQRKPNVGATRG